MSTGGSLSRRGKVGSNNSSNVPAMFVPSIGPSRSVREVIQEVKMVQIWCDIMRSCESRGKELIDAKIIKISHLDEWLRTKGSNQETVNLGIPSYALLQKLLFSIKAGSTGLLLTSGPNKSHKAG